MGVLRRLSPSFRRKSVSSRNVSAIDAEVDFVMQRSPFLVAAEEESTAAADTTNTTATNNSIAEFQRKEFQIGSLLGEGSFSRVHAIIGFRLTADSRNSSNTEKQSRIALSQSAFDSKGRAQLAVKCLKKELTKNSHDFRTAAADLIVEAKYLAALDHPNIVKLRGIARNGIASFSEGHDGFFIIMDRLSESLDQRIQSWKRLSDADAFEDNSRRSSNSNTDRLPTPSLYTKAHYALQIAEALSYLHERRIVYRDLKPTNLAFREGEHTVQLFDFGLCRELPECGSCEQEDDQDDGMMFQMSGAGSRSYMAVEIFTAKKYNLKADVYSWAFCLYEMIALSRPFDHYSFAEHKEFVAEIGMRPELKKEYNLPASLQKLIRAAWEQDPSQRLNIRQVCDKLRPIVSALEQQQHQQQEEEEEEEEELVCPEALEASASTSSSLDGSNNTCQLEAC